MRAKSNEKLLCELACLCLLGKNGGCKKSSFGHALASEEKTNKRTCYVSAQSVGRRGLQGSARHVTCAQRLQAHALEEQAVCHTKKSNGQYACRQWRNEGQRVLAAARFNAVPPGCPAKHVAIAVSSWFGHGCFGPRTQSNMKVYVATGQNRVPRVHASCCRRVWIANLIRRVWNDD